MKEKDVVKDSNFEEYGEVRVDAKNRITLGRKGSDSPTSYKVYRNALGQIILDPHVSIPAHEAWLFKNKKALASVKKGLEEAKQGKLDKIDEDFSKYTDD